MGKPSGGGSGLTNQALNIPPGLLQSLSNVSGLGSFGQTLFDPLASMTNWASNIATGGNAAPIQPFSTSAVQTGPTVGIGTGGPPGHDAWATSFDPQSGQITFTNAQTGQTFQQWYGSSAAQQYIPAATLQQWGQLYQNRGGTPGGAGGTGAGGALTGSSLLGPQLSEAWNQIESIPGLEAQTAAWTAEQQAQGNTLYGEGQKMLREALNPNSGLFPSQQAYVKQATTAEQAALQQQLASEGLSSSTAAGVLSGEAAQQGAATAGQLIQGNIAAAQNQIQIAQASQKLALAGQELSLGESTAMAQLALGFQGQMWTQAMQGYGAIGQIMSTLGNIYGINVAGYKAIMDAGVNVQGINATAAAQQASLAAGAASAQGQGLGSLFSGLTSILGGGGGGSSLLPAMSGLAGVTSSGTGALGSAGLGGVFSGIGSLFGGASGAIGGAAGGIGSSVGSIIGGIAGIIDGF